MAIPMSIVLPAQFQWQCQYQLFSLAIPMAMSISIPINNTTNGNVNGNVNIFASVAAISPKKKPLHLKVGMHLVRTQAGERGFYWLITFCVTVLCALPTLFFTNGMFYGKIISHSSLRLVKASETMHHMNDGPKAAIILALMALN